MTTKKLPPVADRTLIFIVEIAGGAVDIQASTARLNIGRHTIEAADNTQLIIKVLALLKNL